MAAQAGDFVQVHYTGKLSDGEIFDSSEGGEPLKFIVGGGQMIAGFDNAVHGMEIGETKEVVIPAAEAYGEHYAEAVQTVPRELVQFDAEPTVGMQVELHRNDGSVAQLIITEVTDSSITVDANHPLAGKDLHFTIQLVAIGA